MKLLLCVLDVAVSIDMVVSSLSALQHLRHLRFHDYKSHLSNPLCQHVHYQHNIASGLPALMTLDGNCRIVSFTPDTKLDRKRYFNE